MNGKDLSIAVTVAVAIAVTTAVIADAPGAPPASDADTTLHGGEVDHCGRG